MVVLSALVNRNNRFIAIYQCSVRFSLGALYLKSDIGPYHKLN